MYYELDLRRMDLSCGPNKGIKLYFCCNIFERAENL